MSCSKGQPAPTRIWRLSPSQYDHTIAALIPNAGTPSDGFPKLATNEVFADRADKLSLPLLFVDQAFTATRGLAEKARVAHSHGYPCLDSPKPDAGCVRSFIGDFGLRAFRRPLGPDEIDRYQSRFVDAQTKWGTVAAAEDLYRVFLMSPFFLFRTEIGDGTAKSGARTSLTGWEKASALSYLLIDGPPDDELFRAAKAGELATGAQVEAQARRLLGDGNAGRFVRRFFREYLDLDKVLDQPKSAKLFPRYSPETAVDLRDETLSFIEHVLRIDDGRWPTMLSAPYSLVNERLAGLYGVAGVQGSALRKHALPAGQRAGLLTQGAFLAAHASDEETDIVHRGLFVRQRVLCGTVPPPPQNIPPIAPPDRTKTMRERVQAHSSDPVCAGCHRLIDPLGYGFEQYDAAAQFRTAESNGRMLDATGEITGTAADARYDGAADLARKLAASPDVASCLGQQLRSYSLGRDEAPADACLVERVNDALVRSGGNFGLAVLGLVTSEHFLARTVP